MSQEKPLIIDGSYGEGGGQILRTSLSFSSILTRPIRIEHIRLGRKVPGLQPQHLASLRAAGQITGALLEGDRLGSTWLVFEPKSLNSGRFFFNVAEEKGSAGSVSLVMQTLFLPLSFSNLPSEIVVRGGTHVQWSPTYHYLEEVFLPAARLTGYHLELQLERWGWYPLGGGSVKARVLPCRKLTPLRLTEKGKLLRLTGVSAVGNLPLEIAQRQKTAAERILKTIPASCPLTIDLIQGKGPGKGTFFFLLAEYEHVKAGFSSLGERGKPAEHVAGEACQMFREHFYSQGALDPYLADQLLPYLALSSEESIFTTSRVTTHLTTNIWCIKQFLPVEIRVKGNLDSEGEISIRTV